MVSICRGNPCDCAFKQWQTDSEFASPGITKKEQRAPTALQFFRVCGRIEGRLQYCGRTVVYGMAWQQGNGSSMILGIGPFP